MFGDNRKGWKPGHGWTDETQRESERGRMSRDNDFFWYPDIILTEFDIAFLREIGISPGDRGASEDAQV